MPTWNTRLAHAMERRRAKPFQQFGQTDDEYTANGALGCTHTILQFLTWIWVKRWYSHDQVSRIAGYPDNTSRGLRPSEVQRFCTAVGLPYVVKFGWTTQQVLDISVRGPVGLGMSYSRWPEWAYYNYQGTKADSYPNGYARPLGKAGRTQLRGFSPPNDAHFGLLLGWDPASSLASFRVVGWEPNHNSTSRPEDPPYDLMTSLQFKRAYESYKYTLGRSLYALVPTRTLSVGVTLGDEVDEPDMVPDEISEADDLPTDLLKENRE